MTATAENSGKQWSPEEDEVKLQDRLRAAAHRRRRLPMRDRLRRRRHQRLVELGVEKGKVGCLQAL